MVSRTFFRTQTSLNTASCTPYYCVQTSYSKRFSDKIFQSFRYLSMTNPQNSSTTLPFLAGSIRVFLNRSWLLQTIVLQCLHVWSQTPTTELFTSVSAGLSNNWALHSFPLLRINILNTKCDSTFTAFWHSYKLSLLGIDLKSINRKVFPDRLYNRASWMHESYSRSFLEG